MDSEQTTKKIEQRDFGISDCPYCDGTLYFPILDWGAIDSRHYGVVDYRPEYDDPRCANDCTLTSEDILDADIYDHIWADVGEDGWPLEMDTGEFYE